MLVGYQSVEKSPLELGPIISVKKMVSGPSSVNAIVNDCHVLADFSLSLAKHYRRR